MTGAELAFFACTASVGAVLAWAFWARGRESRAPNLAPALLLLSLVPLALLMRAQFAAIAMVSVGVATLLLPSEATKRAQVGASRHPLARIFEAVFLAVLAFVFIGTLARQVVTAGATHEEAAHLDKLDGAAEALLGPQNPWFAILGLVALLLAMRFSPAFASAGGEVLAQGEDT